MTGLRYSQCAEVTGLIAPKSQDLGLVTCRVFLRRFAVPARPSSGGILSTPELTRTRAALV